MDADLPVDGPKAVPGDANPSSPPWRNMASESRTEGHSSPHKGAGELSESSTTATLNNSTATDEMKVAKDLMHEDMLSDFESKDVREGVEAVRDEPSRKRVRFSERGRQGSAPPRLELGINDISPPNVGRKGALASPREHVDSIINGNAVVLAAKDEVAQQETGAMARMEGLLDDLETEVTCGLCAGVFIDPVALNPCSHVFCGSCVVNWLQSYSPSTRMSYTNPFPALKDYMRRMQDISDQRYEDGYDSTSSDEGASPPRSGRARRDPGDGSDSEDDYYPVNPYLQRVRAQESSSATTSSDATVRIGISKTPKNGLACPTCRAQPVVDATGSCLVTSMVELVQKHRPDLVRTANETEQARKVYKKGDKLSFPIPVISSTSNARPANHDAYGAPVASTSAAGSRNAATATVVGEVLVPFTRSRGERRDANDYWSPCAYCTAPRSHEAPDRYVCEEPVTARTYRTDYGCPPGHSLCSICGELGPETIAQTCSGCGEGVCGLPTRGCKIPRLIETDRVAGSTSFTQVERLSTASQISNYSWAGYRDVFQHNYYELAKFVLYCIKKNQSVASSSAYNFGHMTDEAIRTVLEAEAAQKISMANVIKATVARCIDGDGYSSLRGIFQRANKAWPWPRMTEPDRLCKHCVDIMLEASIFEWWMRESASPDVAAQLPARQADCKYGRSCAFQENLEHSKSYNHLCERLQEDEFQASSQPTPLQDFGATTGNISSETLLRRAIIDVGETFGLPRTVMDDLILQEARSSGTQARDGAGTNLIGRLERRETNALYADGDDDSYDSDNENRSREGTPASEIYRERGMESRGVQTEPVNGPVPEEGGQGVRAVQAHATAVGRTVVDENGDSMELDEESDEMEVEDAFLPIAERDDDVSMEDETAEQAPNPTIAFESAFLDYDGGAALEDDAMDAKNLELELAVASPGLQESGSLSRQGSVVEELVTSSQDAYEALPFDAAPATEGRERESAAAIRLQSHAIDRAQQHLNSSARSSPAPEPILA